MTQMMGGFEARVALVTGGAMGIGRGIVEAFVAEGAAVAVADIDGVAAGSVADIARGAGGRALATIGDVSRNDDAARMVAETLAAFGRLDILVNNAGIQPPNSYRRIEDTPEEMWDRILGVNLKSVFLMSRAAIPAMREAGGGVIVNIASVQGLQSMPRVAAYAASKGGMLSLTRSMALDYAPEGIRVVAICPGTIDTEMVRTAARAEAGDEAETIRRYGSAHPLGRIGTPADIGAATVFLASDRASFITGEYLCVDGGFMAQGAWASSAGAEH
jgi:NAD(P)-dependent dehydrogenase (short-subunit alcohol dehydrogenase family)